MLRLLHFSDLHIGVEGHSRPATEADLEKLPPNFAPGVDRVATYLGLPMRLLDSLRAFDELVEAAISEPVDLVVFSGDAYRSRDPSQTQQREFARRIARLTKAGITVFLLAGNHDLPNAFGRATSTEIFDTLSVAGVTVASKPGLYRLETRGGPVQVIAVPWMRRGGVLAQDATKGLTLDELNDYIQAFLSDSVRRMADELDPTVPSVLAAHVTVSTARVGSERSMMLGSDYMLLPSALADPRVDYVALGHIHGHQVLGNLPPMVYPGSLHRVDFSEEGQAKGFCLVVLDLERPAGQRAVEWRFREVWARPFITVKVKVPAEDLDPTARVLAAMRRHVLTEAIVRVEIDLPPGLEGRLDLAEVRRTASAEAHALAGVRVETEREDRTRLTRGMNVERLGPLEALGLYLDSRKTTPDQRSKLLRYAAGLLEPGEGSSLDEPLTATVSVRLAGPQDMKDAVAVRARVFVEEQGIDPVLEWDGQDETAIHAVAVVEGHVVGTGRLLLGPHEARIGRMAVLPEMRRQGIGGRILETLEEAASARGVVQVQLHAQTYVKAFYASHGYREDGVPFTEAGIEHVAMRKTLSPAARDARLG